MNNYVSILTSSSSFSSIIVKCGTAAMISSSVFVKGSSFSSQVDDNLVFSIYVFPLFHPLICPITSFTYACAKRYLTRLNNPSRKGAFNRGGHLLNFWLLKGGV